MKIAEMVQVIEQTIYNTFRKYFWKILLEKVSQNIGGKIIIPYSYIISRKLENRRKENSWPFYFGQMDFGHF